MTVKLATAVAFGWIALHVQAPFALAQSPQLQLGAVPALSPRALAKPATERRVQLTQVDARLAPIGPPHEFTCPDSGCQQALTLQLGDAPHRFLADFQFVARGAYLALQSQSLAVGQVLVFEQGRPGPIFIHQEKNGAMEQQVRLTMSAPGSVRALDAAEAPKPGVLTSGNVFTRKLEPDVILRLVVDPPRPVN